MNEMNQPLFFAPNRVWRCYLGGVLLDRFTGAEEETDGYEPEDWLASTVQAVNGEHSKGPDEGLARVLNADGSAGEKLVDLVAEHGEALLGREHVAAYGPQLGVLCKFLDSAVRLPIQCHPSVPIAQKLYSSNYGKTECWYILDTREIHGEKPYVLAGFKPGITREAFAEVVATQDIPAMEAMLHKHEVQPGEMYFIPAQFPHAIGPGVFMLETQEPSDWVVQPERYCAETRLSDSDMWGALTPEQGLEIFSYEGITKETCLAKMLVSERPAQETEGGQSSWLIDSALTTAFSVLSVRVWTSMDIEVPGPFAIMVITEGDGMLSFNGGSCSVQRGQYCLIPNTIHTFTCQTDTNLEFALCMPPTPSGC